MVNSVVMESPRTFGVRHSGATRSAEPGISRINFEIPGSRFACPGMKPKPASLLRLAGVLHRLEGREFDVVELTVDLLDLADIDVLHDVAGFRIDRDRAARTFPFHALYRL